MVAEYNGSEDEEFSRQTIQGRPKKGLDHNVVELVHKFVMSANVSGSLILIFLLLETNYCTLLKKSLPLRLLLGFGKDHLVIVEQKNIRIQVIRCWLKVIMKILKSEKLNVNIFFVKISHNN